MTNNNSCGLNRLCRGAIGGSAAASSVGRELGDSQENVWQFDDIVDHCCYAWNTLIDQPWKIMSIARRDWAIVGQSI